MGKKIKIRKIYKMKSTKLNLMDKYVYQALYPENRTSFQMWSDL